MRKALYDLRQASRQWHHKLAVLLVSIGFKHSKANNSLYSKTSEESITLVLIYVDDILISGNNLTTINEIKAELSSHFSMKDMGPVSYFLGLEIDRSEAGFFISQKKYVLDLLKEFGNDEFNPAEATNGCPRNLNSRKRRAPTRPPLVPKVAWKTHLFDNNKA